MTRNKVIVLLARNGIFIAVAAMVVVFTILNIRFLSAQNVANMLQQTAELGLVALPLALLIMAGGIDFSVGSVASLSAIVAASTMQATGNWIAGVVAGLAAGAVAGLCNGVLTSYLRLNAFIVTLGALSVWSGLALLISNGRSIAGLPQGFGDFGQFAIGPVRIQLVFFILEAVVVWLVLAKTAFGRQLMASGGNNRAAKLMGIRTNRISIILYVATGVFAGFTGVLLTAKFQSATPTVGSGLELQTITVVLLGGVAMSGGSGRVSGVIAGLLFVGVLRNGLIILGVSQFILTIVTGAVLIIAIAFDGTMQRMVKQTWSQVRPLKPTPDRASEEAVVEESVSPHIGH